MMPLWVKIVAVLSGWLGSAIPLTPELCLLGDKSQIPNISKGRIQNTRAKKRRGSGGYL